MRCYINNFSTTLTKELGENKNDVRLVLEDQAMQSLTETLTTSNGCFFIRLTLQNDDASVFELIDVYKDYWGDFVILGGGREGTQPVAWPAGTRVLCATTAGSFRNTTMTKTVSGYESDRETIIEIDYREGKSQKIKLYFYDKPMIYSVVISNMLDGESLILELPSNELPLFLNASVLEVQASTLVQVFRHNGWHYVRPLGNFGRRITSYFPFTAKQYREKTVFVDEITKQEKQPVLLEKICHLIHGNKEALLLHNYIGRHEKDKLFFNDGLYGNALTIRIKPGHFEDYPMMLAVLYGKPGDDFGKEEMLIIAILNYQLVTYYYKENSEFDSLKKTETGFYINKDDKWTSIGLNFCSKTGYGLADVCTSRSSKFNLNITPLKEFNQFALFGLLTEADDINCVDDDNEPIVFHGGIAKATVYSSCFDYDGFAAILKSDEYDDTKDVGPILMDIPCGGLIAKIYTEVKIDSGNLPGGGNGDSGSNGDGNDNTGGGSGSGGGGGDINNDNSVEIGGSGGQNPLG